MRLFVAGLLALCFLRIEVHAQTPDAALKALYDSHRWFALRETVAKGVIAPAPFYEAAVETTFHQDERAKIDLKQYIASHPALDMLVEARELLLGMEFRSAHYQDALLEAQQILAIRPDAKDVANFLPTLNVLAPFVRQTVVSREASMVRFELLDQNLVLPVAIDGTTVNFILDNGFSLSGMSESEAQRLKLSVQTVSTAIDTMSGAPVNIRIAVVRDLAVGRVHLRNVAFYVLPDDQPPFNQRAPGHRGILGLQVVLALGHFAWQPASRTFRIFSSSSGGPAPGANLAFDGSSVFTQLIFRGRTLDVSLDTGAENTVLYSSFAKQFPDIQGRSTTEQHRITGVGGSRSISSFTLPSLSFRLGGVDVALKPASVLLEENNSTSAWFKGNLGMDLLNQARSVDLDFGSMTLSLK
jgi:predicted aspartyl protease